MNTRPGFQSARFAVPAVLLIAVVLLEYPVFRRTILDGRDFTFWADAAEEMIQKGKLTVSHFLWPMLVALISQSIGHQLTEVTGIPDPYRAASLGGMVLVLSTLAILLYRYLVVRLDSLFPWLAAGLALALLVAAPVPVLLPFDGKYYLGYVGLAIYHNPTNTMVKPLAVLSFWLAMRMTQSLHQPTVTEISCAAVVTAFSVFAKPSWMVCFLPALLVQGLWRSVRGQPAAWTCRVIAFVLPTGIDG